MSPNAFFGPLDGQSLLIPGQSEIYRGQCVQSVGLYVANLDIAFPAYPQAYMYYQRGIPGYVQVSAGNPIKQGDIIVWRADFPASPGAGHIDVAAQDGTLANFVAWDSNWYPPLKLAKLSHLGNNNNYIAGYLRREEEVMTEDGVRYGYLAITRKLTTDKDAGYTEADVKYWTGRDSTEFTKNLWGQSDYHYGVALAEITQLEAQLAAGSVVLKPGKYQVN